LIKDLKKYPLSIAPMMDWTDRHYRYFMRQITKKTFLYTEMITTGALLHGNRKLLLDFSELEKPLSLQVGGDHPAQLAECARMAEAWNYDEINLNVGCPSDRVQNGNFGACLMARPELVANCIAEMKKAVKIPVTVKHRIGIDEKQSYEDLANFVKIVAASGCDRFIVHARIAILKGLSPKENRTIPPLRYDDVYQIKRDFSEQIVEINGGIKSLEQAQEQLKYTDGVMIGRAAYDDPYLFAEADRRFFGENYVPPTRKMVAEAMIPYIEFCLGNQVKLGRILPHLAGLFNGQPGSRVWKRYLSENMHLPGKGAEIISEVLEKIS